MKDTYLQSAYDKVAERLAEIPEKDERIEDRILGEELTRAINNLEEERGNLGRSQMSALLVIYEKGLYQLVFECDTLLDFALEKLDKLTRHYQRELVRNVERLGKLHKLKAKDSNGQEITPERVIHESKDLHAVKTLTRFIGDADISVERQAEVANAMLTKNREFANKLRDEITDGNDTIKIPYRVQFRPDGKKIVSTEPLDEEQFAILRGFLSKYGKEIV